MTITAPATPDVLDAALEAFLDFGVRRTSMGEIARRAGISPATLYRRYAQKSDVVMGVGLREAQRILAHLEDVIDTSAPPLEQLTALHVEVAHQLRSNELLRRVLATEPETVLPKLTVDADPILEIGRGYLAGFLTRLQQEGHLPPYDVAPVADWLARLAQSDVLTPAREPLTPEQTAVFVRDHLAPFIRLTVDPRS
ncbi:TetR/AcrR family transcriptional regulator [Nocardioides marmoriginsengisoli]|uniref:TetR/AcrR family transcriptional regulator n=1 Tax=Nocardioides marmoriginsengisoli TaxID=661483 RepID=A0A3N0CHP7_9ACTN|nr:TetR/AcrR family transcriptional regulator [Nocardioides marmoriginsengisoli]RNL62982.1 TetR/AcrR family transcriptional regulator [Nocardioides marmoriginsengisoli]